MRLISLNKFICFLILNIFLQPSYAEEQIDIWNKDIKQKKETIKVEEEDPSIKDENIPLIPKLSKKKNEITIENEIVDDLKDREIFGVYDPQENDFNLTMWTETEADDVRSSFKRINKINLSNTATKLFENTILSFAYPPKGMDQKEFINLKINWLTEK